MKNTLLFTCVLAALAGGGLARAETISVPRDGSGISLDVPPGWTSVARGDGVILMSPGVSVRLEFTPQREPGDTLELLRREGHKLAEARGVSVTDEKLNKPSSSDHGVKSETYALLGKTGDRDRILAVTLLTPPTGTACLLRTMLDPWGQENPGPGLDALLASFRPGEKPPSPDAPAPGARGGAVKFPADGSGVVIAVPAGWTATAEAGFALRVQTDDKALTVVFLPAKGIADTYAEAHAMARLLAEGAGIQDGKIEEREDKSRVDQGVTIYTATCAGRLDGHETVVTTAAITPAKGDPCIAKWVVDPAAAKPHQHELDTLLAQIKPAQ